MMIDHVSLAREYRAGVLDGTISACEFVKQACQRSLDDENKQGTLGYPFRFDAEKASRVCRFMELLRHVQGPLANTRLKLEPWQCFCLTELFGWVWSDNGMRRYRRSYIEVPKGNGKSLLAAGVTLYLAFAEGEGGADAVCTATSMEQSRIVLDTARQMCLKDDGLTRKFGLEVKAHKIEQAKTTSRLRGLPSKASSIEGVSLAAGVVDELHASKNREVLDNLRTACSKRPQALLFIITTAGGDSSGIGYETSNYAKSILAGEKDDAQFFAIIWTIPENADWTQESVWRMANPNFGVSVDARGLAAECNRAIQLASNEQAFLCKHLCVWTGSGGEEPFLPFATVRRVHDDKLSDEFEGQQCAVGIDLASRLDMCSVVRVHSKRIDAKVHFFVFAKSWLPAATIAKSKNASYGGWLRQGWLYETPGSVTDLEVIEQHVAELFGKYSVRDVSFDPLQSNYLVTRLQKQFPDKAEAFVEFGQWAKFMTPGMQELETACTDGRVHSNNPMIPWTLSNLRVKRVGQNLMYPMRPRDHALKIDCAVALVMALRGCSITPLDESVGSVYDTRGIEFI